MVGRLLLGIVKGLLIGALLGFGLVKLGDPAPGAVLAYLAAAFSGVLVGLVAGKPIWAKDAKIEAGMKAFVGAVLGAGLMYAARRFLTMPLPIALHELAGPNASLGEAAGTAGTLGGVAMTSLAAVSALLGGFYEVDNDPGEGASPRASAARKEAAGKRRIAPGDAAEEELEGDASRETGETGETDKKRSKS